MNLRFFLFFLLVFSAAINCNAAEPVGAIAKLTGNVYCYRATSPKPHPVTEPPFAVYFGDQVQTRKKSTAALHFAGVGKVVLEERSSLILNNRHSLVAEEGAILFDIKKAGQAKGITVTSAAVTIGVKGTRFAVVNRGGTAAIFLKSGELKLNSNTPQAMFRLKGELSVNYQDQLKLMKDNYEKTRRGMADEHAQKAGELKKRFDGNRSKMEKGDLSEVSEFELTSGMAVLIDGQNLYNIKIPKDWELKFKQLDSF